MSKTLTQTNKIKYKAYSAKGKKKSSQGTFLVFLYAMGISDIHSLNGDFILN